MNINNENIDISDLVSQKYMHKQLNNGLFLSDYQMEILKMNNIDYERVSSTKELIYMIQEVIMEEDNEELEDLSKEISEFDYYHNTNK